MSGQKDKFQMLMQMHEQGRRVTSLFFAAEAAQRAHDLAKTTRLFTDLIEAQKHHITLAEQNNAQFPDSPYDLPPIVQPLVNSLFRFADILEAGGKKAAQTNALREEAVAYSKKYLSSVQLADAKRSQVAAMLQQARFNEALLTLAEVREVFRAENDLPKMARVTIDRADLLHWLGDTQRAKQELDEAAQAIEPLIQNDTAPDVNFLSAVLQSIQDIQSGAGDGKRGVDAAELYRVRMELDFYRGLVCKTDGDHDDAIKFFEKALPEYEKLGSSSEAIRSQIAAIRVAQGHFQEGIEIVDFIEPAFHKNTFLRPKLAVLRKVKAEALFGMKRFDEALSLVNEAIAEYVKYPDPDVSWKTFFLQGQILEANGQLEQALIAFKQAASIIDNLRKSPLGYRLDSTYLKDKIPLFDAAIRLAVRMQDGRSACEFIEMIKSRALTAALSTSAIRKSGSADREKQELDNLTRKIGALEYRVYREGDANGKLKSERQMLLIQRREVLEKIRYADPRWRHMTEPVAFHFDEILELTREKEIAVLNLYKTGEAIFVVLLQDGKAQAARLPLTQKVFKSGSGALSQYIQNLHQQKQTYDFYYDPKMLGLDADKLIPETFLREASRSRRLVIVPHGELHLLPWGSLIYDSKRLFEYCPVSVLPNLSSLQMLSGASSEVSRAVLFGDPKHDGLKKLDLPCAGVEMETIEQLYRQARKGVESFQGVKASEAKFRSIIEEIDGENAVLHVACHGEFESIEPMTSGLLFTDGRVDAAEIADSGLQFDEVVLSACSCGWRPTEVDDVQLVGDDILGLPGAFLEAGAKSVLLSISRAGDEAACEFMIQYHRNRLAGQAPPEALQTAQKSMLANPDYKPYQWAGFTLYARPV